MSRLLFWCDRTAWAVRWIASDEREANAVCARNPLIGVIDSNKHGVWMASLEGVDCGRPVERWSGPNRVGLENGHLGLYCLSMGRVHQVVEIDDRGLEPPPSVARRRAREGMVMVAKLEDGRGIYAPQYAGARPSAAIDEEIWRKGLPV